MNHKDIKKLSAMAAEKLAAGVTKGEALATLKAAGILTNTVKFAKPYSNLARVVITQQ